MEFVPNEKAMPIRYPSIANLMVDSEDRTRATYPYCSDFQINKKNSLLNGFFTRVGATEVVFEWATGNVGGQNGVFNYVVGGTPYSFTLGGFFTAEELINAIVANANTFTGPTGLTWSAIATEGGGAILTVTGASGIVFSLTAGVILQLTASTDQFAGTVPVGGTVDFDINSETVDLRGTRYIDIICSQLTNNQAVKDASTAQNPRDVLVRWYFAYDNQSPVDGYGIPILMGYTPFVLRRLYNPPKQIQWQTNIPVGNLSLQLYDDKGEIAVVSSETNYLMTLQISEN